jgi:hypothetical protein
MAIEMDTIYAENLSLLHFGDLMTLERLEPHFINAIHKLYKESRVEGMSIEIKSTNFSSFFGKKSAVLAIEFKKSKIKKLSANFFVLKNGNVYSLRLSRQIHATYLDTLREKPQVQKIELLKNSFKGISERYDFSFFDEFITSLYTQGLKSAKQLQEEKSL